MKDSLQHSVRRLLGAPPPVRLALLIMVGASGAGASVMSAFAVGGAVGFGIFVCSMTVTSVVVLILKAEMEQLTESRRLGAKLARLATDLTAQNEAVATDLTAQNEAVATDLTAQNEAVASHLATLRQIVHQEAESRATSANEMERRLDELEASTGHNTAELRNLGDGVEAITGMLARLTDDVDQIHQRTSATDEAASAFSSLADDRLTSMTRRMERQRWSTIGLLAAQRSSGGFPRHLLLQVTISRTGSTRLFDILRSHPAAYVEPLTFLWDELGLVGRRYPVGLSGVDTSTERGTPIVTQDRIAVTIRSMKAARPEMADPGQGGVAVEKAHPQFFDFDAKGFHKQLEGFRTRTGTRVTLIYQIRNPLDVMWSIAEYKERDPTWQGALEVGEVPALVARSFQSLCDLALLEPGMVIDYNDYGVDHSRLHELSDSVDPEMSISARSAWIEAALSATDLDRIGSATFVGERSLRNPDGPEGVWSKSGLIIGDAEHAYRRLLSLDGLSAGSTDDAPTDQR